MEVLELGPGQQVDGWGAGTLQGSVFAEELGYNRYIKSLADA